MKTILAMVICLIMVGCSTDPTIAVTKTQYVIIEPAVTFKDKQTLTTPPSKDLFIQATDKERIDMLVKYGIKLQNDVASCNDRIDAIYKNVEEKKALYKDKEVTTK